MDLCLALAASSVLLLRVPSPATLAWRHSVEQVQLEETWRATPAGLLLEQVRGRGLGAGIDVPQEARFAEGWWWFRPQRPPLPELLLANSAHAGGYRLCWNGGCQALSGLPGAADAALRLRAC